MNKNKKVIIYFGIAALAVFLIIFIGISLTSNVGTTSEGNSAEAKLEKIVKKITVKEKEPVKGQISLVQTEIADLLPDISKFPVTVENTTDTYVEIFGAPEQTGTGNDGWLNEVAAEFNKSQINIDGNTASVKIRYIASGTGTDYIISRAYTPDAFTFSNRNWAEIIKFNNIGIDLISDSMVDNVAGIVIENRKNAQLLAKYGEINVKTVTEAVAAGELAMAYTDPFTSSTGLNFLLTALKSFDEANPLSLTAEEGFLKFQSNLYFSVAQTTMQLKNAAANGSIEGLVMEYQTYNKDANIKAQYTFTPFGIKHDGAMYAMAGISETKRKILDKFVEFSKQEKYQKLAGEYGFNQLEYVPEAELLDGETIARAQTLWKEKKNADKSICAVFVADVSGSMDGEPINKLKESLIKGQEVIGQEHYIGLVSYGSTVDINLPIAQFDLNQRSLFVGTVESLQVAGKTATMDGIAVAMSMIQKQLSENPDMKPIIFLLSDGDSNTGHSLNSIRSLIEEFSIPIYTIGYNANIDALKEISNINEADSINADTDDVVYKIRNLFNAQM